MKKSVLTAACAGMFALTSAYISGCGTESTTRQSNPNPPSTVQYSYNGIDDLDAYGQWYTLPPYGNVWKPNVESEWRPFYYGHWDYTSPNWTWVSYEPFGWVVYHYGDWFYSGTYGWVWVPNNGPWSPATVDWVYYDDFVGWAPHPPRDVVLPRPWERDQMGVEVWSVVHARDFPNENIGQHRLEGMQARPHDQRDQIVHHVPDPKMIEQYSGHPVQNVKITREPVKFGKQQLHRIQVPPQDQERADKHKGEVDQKVTRRTGNRR